MLMYHLLTTRVHNPNPAFGRECRNTVQSCVLFVVTGILLFLLSDTVLADDRVFGWRSFRQSDGLASNLVSDIVQTEDGSVWFATVGAGISRYDGRRWVTFTEADGLPGNIVLDLFEDADGTLWAATEQTTASGRRGVARLSGDSWEILDLPSQLGDARVHQIESFGSGICFATEHGILHYDGSSVSPVDGIRDADAVEKFVWDDEGGLWAAIAGRGLPHQLHRKGNGDETHHAGLSRYDRHTRSWETIPVPPLFEDAEVLAMAQTTDGRVWFGTANQGLFRYDGSAWHRLTRRDGLPADRVQALRPDGSGRVWVGTPAGAGLLDDRDGTVSVQTFTEDNGLPSDFVTAIWVGGDGSVWVATRGGAARYGPTGWVHYHAWPGEGDGRTLIDWVDNRLLALTGRGVYAFDGADWTTETVFPRKSRPVDLLRDDDGVTWAVTSRHVAALTDEGWRFIQEHDVQIGEVLSSASDKSGLWLGGTAGAQRLTGTGQPVPVLSEGLVFAIESSEGALWMAVDSTVLAGPKPGELRPIAVPLESASALYLSDDGRLWAASITGGVNVRDTAGVWTSVRVEGADLNGVRRFRHTAQSDIWMASTFDGAIRTDGKIAVRYSRSSGLPTRVFGISLRMRGVACGLPPPRGLPGMCPMTNHLRQRYRQAGPSWHTTTTQHTGSPPPISGRELMQNACCIPGVSTAARGRLSIPRVG